MRDLVARKALIIKLANNYDWSASNFTEDQLGAYLEATADCSLDALARAVGQFMQGRVDDHNNARMPSGAQLAAKARVWDAATTDTKIERLVTYRQGELPPPPLEPLGPLVVDFGHGPINMRGMTAAEKESVLVSASSTSGASPFIPQLPKVPR